MQELKYHYDSEKECDEIPVDITGYTISLEALCRWAESIHGAGLVPKGSIVEPSPELFEELADLGCLVRL